MSKKLGMMLSEKAQTKKEIVLDLFRRDILTQDETAYIFGLSLETFRRYYKDDLEIRKANKKLAKDSEVG